MSSARVRSISEIAYIYKQPKKGKEVDGESPRKLKTRETSKFYSRRIWRSHEVENT